MTKDEMAWLDFMIDTAIMDNEHDDKIIDTLYPEFFFYAGYHISKKALAIRIERKRIVHNVRRYNALPSSGTAQATR